MILELEKCANGEYVQPLAIWQGANGGKSEASDAWDYLKDKELYCIGHPWGLPLVISDKARVHPDKATATYFGSILTDLDIFPGNSGSPVFVKDSDAEFKLIGVLSSEFTDEEEFVMDMASGCIKLRDITNEVFESTDINNVMLHK